MSSETSISYGPSHAEGNPTTSSLLMPPPTGTIRPRTIQGTRSSTVAVAPGVEYKILTPEQLGSVRERLKAISTLLKNERDPYMKAQLQRDYKAILSEELESNVAQTKLEVRKLRGELETEKRNGEHDRRRLSGDVNRLSKLLQEKEREVEQERQLRRADRAEMQALMQKAAGLEDELRTKKRQTVELELRAQGTEKELQETRGSLEREAKRTRLMRDKVVQLNADFGALFPVDIKEEHS